MYIRWVHRGHKNAASAGLIFHDAYLVENIRVERGQPRQRVVCYLGNLREIDGIIPPIERELFLERAQHALSCAAAREPVDTERILDLLRQQLPTLTEHDAAELLRLQLGWFFHWWERHGSGSPHDELARIVDTLHGHERSRTV